MAKKTFDNLDMPLLLEEAIADKMEEMGVNDPQDIIALLGAAVVMLLYTLAPLWEVTGVEMQAMFAENIKNARLEMEEGE